MIAEGGLILPDGDTYVASGLAELELEFVSQDRIFELWEVPNWGGVTGFDHPEDEKEVGVPGGEVLATLLDVAPGPADLAEILLASLEDIDIHHREPLGGLTSISFGFKLYYNYYKTVKLIVLIYCFSGSYGFSVKYWSSAGGVGSADKQTTGRTPSPLAPLPEWRGGFWARVLSPIYAVLPLAPASLPRSGLGILADSSARHPGGADSEGGDLV